VFFEIKVTSWHFWYLQMELSLLLWLLPFGERDRGLDEVMPCRPKGGLCAERLESGVDWLHHTRPQIWHRGNSMSRRDARRAERRVLTFCYPPRPWHWLPDDEVWSRRLPSPQEPDDVIVFFAKILDYLCFSPTLLRSHLVAIFVSCYAFEAADGRGYELTIYILSSPSASRRTSLRGDLHAVA
jgi:hypothetical protein